MAGWDDFVLAAQPRLINYPFDTTENADWKFMVGPFKDANGDAVDLSAAACVCEVLTEVDGTVVATWAVTGDANGFLTGVLDDASTGSLAAYASPRRCIWYCHGTLAGAKVYFWGPTNSDFIIEQGA